MNASEKQITRVLNAVREGYATSNEISEHTGLSVGHVSHYLGELVACGLVRIAYRARTRYADRGRFSHWYEPA